MIAFILRQRRYWARDYFYITGVFAMSVSSIMMPVSEIGLFYKVMFMIMGGFCLLAGYDVGKWVDGESMKQTHDAMLKAQEDANHQAKMIEKRIKLLKAQEQAFYDREKQRQLEAHQRIERRNAEWAARAIERRKGYVYLLKGDKGTHKIGRTSNPNSRVKTFGVELPFDVDYVHLIQTDDMYRLESELQVMYNHKNIRAEWFALDEQDIAAICAIQSPFNFNDKA